MLLRACRPRVICGVSRTPTDLTRVFPLIVGVAPFDLEFEVSIAFKGAPEKLFSVGPMTLQLTERELDFGEGFPIAPW